MKEIESIEIGAVAKTPKILFLHIPKTGGTTVQDALVSQIGRQYTFPSVAHPVIAAASDDELSKYRLFSGHYNRISVDRPALSDAARISVLRDPAERILSLYNFWRSITDEYVQENNLWHVRIAKRMTLSEFAARDSEVAFFTCNGLSRNLISQVDEDHYSSLSATRLAQIAIEYLSTFDHVLLTPFLGLQIPEMMESMGLARISGVGFRREIGTHHDEESYLQRIELAEYDDKTFQQVVNDNEADYLVYDHFLKLYTDGARHEIAKYTMKIQRENIRLKRQLGILT